MSNRRRDRKLILELLYEIDVTGKSLKDILEAKQAAGIDIKLSDFAAGIITGVLKNRQIIDSVIERYSEGWKISRMPVVDRNILRIGVYEMLYEDEIPVAVSINECVELAKVYSTDDARKFVNGVLGKISRELDRIVAEVKAI